MGHHHHHLLLLRPSKSSLYSPAINASLNTPQRPAKSNVESPFAKQPIIVPTLISLAVTATLSSPLTSSAIPSLTTTPFAQSKSLQTGLENGKIRPCPSINPGCISSNPKSASFSIPWMIPENYSGNAMERLKEAILKTQTNVKIEALEDTPDGQYLRAEVFGGFGKDVIEFLVKRDVVAYRAAAKNVTYVYPFTTALGNSKGQEERLKSIVDELGWYAPSFDAMDSE